MFLPPSPHRQGKPGERCDHGHGVGGQGRYPECRQNFIYRHIALLSEGAARARTLLARAGIVARAGRRKQQGWLQACPRRPSAKTGHEKCKKTGGLCSFAVSFAHRGETSPAFPQVNHIVRTTPRFASPQNYAYLAKSCTFLMPVWHSSRRPPTGRRTGRARGGATVLTPCFATLGVEPAPSRKGEPLCPGEVNYRGHASRSSSTQLVTAALRYTRETRSLRTV